MSASETAVIACILRDPSVLDDISLTADQFNGDTNKLVYSTILALKSAGRPIDSVTVAANSNADLIDYEYSDADVGNVKAYAKLVLNEFKVREVHRATSAATRAIASGQPVADVIRQGITQLANIESIGSSSSVVSIRQPLDRLMAKVTNPVADMSLKSGLKAFDDGIGGMRAGQLIIICGRPAMGKSALAGGLAMRVVRSDPKKAVAIFSLEMTAEELAGRFASEIAGVDQGRIRDGVFEPKHIERLRSASAHLADKHLYIDDKPGQTVTDIVSSCRRLQRSLNVQGVELAMVMIDHIQLVKADDPTSSENSQLTQISKQLKESAKELGLPVVALSQLNRSVESRDDKRPILSDLRASGSLEQDTDSCVGVYRHEYYYKGQKPGLVELLVLKCRNGTAHTQFCSFDGALTKFDDLTPAQRAAFGV